MLCVSKSRLKGKISCIWAERGTSALSKTVQLRNFSMNSRDHAFGILGLRTFSEAEVAKSFARLKAAQEVKVDSTDTSAPPQTSDLVNIHRGIDILAKQEYSIPLDQKTINKISEMVTGTKASVGGTEKNDVVVRGQSMTLSQYQKNIHDLGEKLDPRVWNIGLSFLCTGTSVGIIIPCMPLLVSQLHIPPSEFGLVISAFGLSKLIGNIPSGYFVEKYGRKPIIMAGLGMCGVGLGSIGLALLPGFGTPWLIACRLVSGLGVSGFVAGGYMFMSDISTPLNRTRTIAPVMAGFSGGAALGPAVGGVLIDAIGIGQTYATVGGMFLTLAMMNSLLHETKNFAASPSKPTPTTAKIIDVPVASTATDQQAGKAGTEDDFRAEAPKVHVPTPVDAGVLGSFSEAFSAWKVLWNDPNRALRHTVMMNGMFWFTLSGTQMTLLPLLLVSPAVGVDVSAAVTGGLAMSAAEIGASFAFMSLVSFVSAQPMAYIADKYGKIPTILGGCGLLSVSMAALPLTTSLELALPFATSLPAYTPALVAVLLPFALSTTALNATPTALVADLTEPASRAQALSLLRTSGDLGLLLGASCAGAVASYSSLGTALEINGALTAAAMFWFASKNRHVLSALFTSSSIFGEKKPPKA